MMCHQLIEIILNFADKFEAFPCVLRSLIVYAELNVVD